MGETEGSGVFSNQLSLSLNLILNLSFPPPAYSPPGDQRKQGTNGACLGSSS